MCLCDCRLKESEPRKSLDETDDTVESSDDERSYETPEEKRKRFDCDHLHANQFNDLFFHSERRLDFEKRRKLHYNEFEALKLARKLLEEDEEEDDPVDGNKKKHAQPDEPSASSDKSSDKTTSNAVEEVEMDNENS